MTDTRRWRCCAAILGAFTCMPLVGSAAEPSPALLTEALERRGFDVTQGRADVWNRARDWCTSQPGVEHAWYNNNAPYLALMVPKGGADAATSSEPVLEFKLRPDEAIVLVGKTPPPERYFAFYPWIATKVYPDGTSLPQLNIGVVDPVNYLSIKTDNSPDKPFNSRVVLIFAADQRTYEDVFDALKEAKYSEDYVNKVVFPASVLNLGHGDTADTFRIQMRNAMWEDDKEGEAYIRAHTEPQTAPPLQIFRVTPKTPREERDASPIPMPPLRVRGTGQSEVHLWNKLVELRRAIIESNPAMDATDIPVTVPVGYEGIDSMQRKELVGGDARDAFCLQAGYLPEFLWWDRQITLADDEFLMAFGANHVATGKTSYMSVNVYTGDAKDGKLSIGTVDDRKLSGTAAPYLRDDPAADLMYAYKISRKCPGGYLDQSCLQVPSEDLLTNCTRLTVGPRTVLGVIFRMYLEPATMSGAVMPEVLYDRVIKFSPRKPRP